jgi:adenylate cyclase
MRLRYFVDGQEHFIALGPHRVRIGRGGDNDVVLSDVSVSRYHAEIRPEGQAWAVYDLQSTNGLEVNRVPVERAALHPGDKLGIGTFELTVEGDAAAAEPERSGRSVLPGRSTSPVLANATIIRPLSELAALDLHAVAASAPGAEAETRDEAWADRMFRLLTRLARDLIVADSVDQVTARVVDLAFDAFPVDRGFVLLSDERGELVCELSRLKDRVVVRPAEEVPVSRTMLQAVMGERVALVTFDAQSDQRLSGGESIRLHQIRSAMCAPLWSGDRIFGVVQVDSPVQVGAFGERELDVLATFANYAAVALERIRYARQAEVERQMRSRLERYHSPAVIEEVLRGSASEDGVRRLQLAETSVLFADLVGFTAYAEDSAPERVADLLSGFLNLAVEAIFRAGGTLDKFIGDCVMAFFGAPVAQPDHALRAVRAAVEIQEGLAQWSAEREARGLPGLAARVAVNSGPVVVGDVGTDRRVDYTVLGNTVNVAARLESSVARPGDVVLGPATHELLGGAFPTEPLGEFQLGGLTQKVTAWRVKVPPLVPP